jgi:hypothetical protein
VTKDVGSMEIIIKNKIKNWKKLIFVHLQLLDLILDY